MAPEPVVSVGTQEQRAIATKAVLRSKHRLVMDMARQGKSSQEIKDACFLIDWSKEIDWHVEDQIAMAEAAKKETEKNPAPQPQQIPIPPPNGGPQVAVDAKTS